MNKAELKSFLDLKADQYNNPSFIEEDPISIPHNFSRKEDIEISGFLTATIAWGNRKSIINNASRLMILMEEAPYDFVINHELKDLSRLNGFVHRTFNSKDLAHFIRALKHIYTSGGLEKWLTPAPSESNPAQAISRFKKKFFEPDHDFRTEKHVADPLKGSSAKRINMFLRWMARKDQKGVDFGIWEGFPPSKLSIPLDVHSGNVARELRLLKRNQNDRKAVELLDDSLRQFNPTDPVKYDYALFGLGINEGFGKKVKT